MTLIAKIINLGLICFFAAIPLWPGGQSEAGGSQARGKYLVDQGRIIPDSEIHIDSYLAQVDYNYPAPANDLGINFLSGQQLVSMEGQELILQIGIQGMKGDFYSIPPLNLCFVLDVSGSMADADKIDWLKQGMALCLKKIRYNDTISVLVTGERVETILPPVKAHTLSEPEKLIKRIGELRPYGKTDLAAGLKKGYAFLEQEYNPAHVNRLILLSDGLDENKELLALPETYKAKGINITTIGFGISYNLDFMLELTKAGGGSSRFISDTAKLDEVFNTEFDRMIVPVARDINIHITFSHMVTGIETWGYDYRIEKNKIEYFLPTLHFRDYETTLIRFHLPRSARAGPVTLARLELEYTNLAGNRIKHNPLSLKVTYVPRKQNTGISYPTVLIAGTMMELAMALQDIGYLYYSYEARDQEVFLYRDSNFTINHVESDSPVEKLIRKEKTEVNNHYLFNIKRAMDVTLLALKEIEMTRLCLEEQLFVEEEYILEKYIDIISGSAGYYGKELEELKNRKEIRKEYTDVPREEILNAMIAELLARGKPGESIAFNGFRADISPVPYLVRQIDRLARGTAEKHDRITVIDSGGNTGAQEPSNRELALETGRETGAVFFMTGFVRMQENTALLILRLYHCTTGNLEAVTRATILLK